MKFKDHDRKLAQECLPHWRENLVKAQGPNWNKEVYLTGEDNCSLCNHYGRDCTELYGVPRPDCYCPLLRLGEGCGGKDSVYDYVIRHLVEVPNSYEFLIVHRNVCKDIFVHAIREMIRVLELIAAGSCTIKEAKYREKEN